jgi:hypothetical protein
MTFYFPVLATSLVLLSNSSPAAIVLTNFPGPSSITNLIKGTGGVIANPLEYGFEFTVSGGDHQLITLSLDVGMHLGTVPITVELYASPSGPDTAAFVTDLTGPAQPGNQIATFAPALSTTLTDGETYFVRMRVNGNGSSYGINRTSTAATGTWTMGNYFTRPSDTGAWNAGGFSPETMVEIEASPVPEPSAAAFGGAVLLLTLRRQRA